MNLPVFFMHRRINDADSINCTMQYDAVSVKYSKNRCESGKNLCKIISFLLYS